jgi:anti-sigma factor RsiW
VKAAISAAIPSGLPYIITHPELAAGFLFAHPLRAGHPDDPANRILWVVRMPRTRPLTIDGHPLGAATPTFNSHAQVELNYLAS